jgi:hypothetical protein
MTKKRQEVEDVEREEDLGYGTIPGEECGAVYGPVKRWGGITFRCTRHKGHVHHRHRNCEISWTDEMTAKEVKLQQPTTKETQPS